MSLLVQCLSDKAIAPKRGSAKAAGYDIYSACNITVPKRRRALVKTDIAITVPNGTYGRIAPRSGIALKYGIDVGAGVIDQDYTGPVGVLLYNNGTEDFNIRTGDRIAQLIIEKIETPEVVIVDSLINTDRGTGGFGSTGV